MVFPSPGLCFFAIAASTQGSTIPTPYALHQGRSDERDIFPHATLSHVFLHCWQNVIAASRRAQPGATWCGPSTVPAPRQRSTYHSFLHRLRSNASMGKIWSCFTVLDQGKFTAMSQWTCRDCKQCIDYAYLNFQKSS